MPKVTTYLRLIIGLLLIVLSCFMISIKLNQNKACEMSFSVSISDKVLRQDELDLINTKIVNTSPYKIALYTGTDFVNYDYELYVKKDDGQFMHIYPSRYDPGNGPYQVIPPNEESKSILKLKDIYEVQPGSYQVYFEHYISVISPFDFLIHNKNCFIDSNTISFVVTK